MRCILKTFPVRLKFLRERWPPGIPSRTNYACGAPTANIGGLTTRHVPIRDDSGCIVRWYVLATDIEDRKRAEHASRSAIDGIAGLVAILAPNGEVETVNRPLFEYFGRSLGRAKELGNKRCGAS